MLGINIDYDKRIYGFDLLRAFAIFCVIHGHGKHLLEGTTIESFPWIKLPHGVDIFFVLSGFLIGYSFIANVNKTNGKLALKKSLNFWKRSTLRILPNYYLILALNYLLVTENILPGSIDKFNLGLFFTFTQNLFYPFYNFFWESWSLAVQEWFYFLFPLLLLVLTRITNIKKAVLIISVSFIVLSICYRLSISNVEYDSFWWDVSIRKVTVSRIDSIFFGVIAAWIRYYFPEIWNKYAVHSFLAGIILFLLVSYVPHTINSMYTNVLFLSLSAIYIMLWFPFIDRLKNIKTVFGKFISHISVLSYAMYLFNLMIIQILDKNYPDIMAMNASLKYLTYWGITLAYSYLLYVIFENPISVYGNRALHTTKMMYRRVRER
mgnify:CR=1 FL=1